MIDIGLHHIVSSFRNREPEPEQQLALFKEVLLLTLARATSADSNIHPIEVETVRREVKEATGEDVSPADIRVAAVSELYETASLDRYLSRAARDLTLAHRLQIAHSLANVIKSDGSAIGVNDQEVHFFNRVARALDLGPAELIGLIEKNGDKRKR